MVNQELLVRIFIPLLIGAAIHLGSVAAAIPTIDYRAEVSDETTLVGMECHWKNRTLEIGNYSSLNRPTRRMDLWSTFDLVVWDEKTSDVIKTLSVERSCKLGDATYRVRFTGAPGGSNAARRCGAFVTARATVWKNGRKLFDQEFEECMGQKRAIANVRFTPGSDQPVISYLPAH